MITVTDSSSTVSVIAREAGTGARYSIEVLGEEIHQVSDPRPPSYNLMLEYYMRARQTLNKKLKELDKDTKSICQELQISINARTSR